MDLPEYLEDGKFVNSTEEIKQTMSLLLRNSCGRFCQSPILGSRVALHSVDKDEVIEGVRETLAQIPGVVITSCRYVQDEVLVLYRYKGEPNEFIFSVTTI